MKVRRARVEDLEPRVLLSGDLAGALALPPAHHAEETPRAIVEPNDHTADQRTTHAVVFVDAGVDDWETLVDDLLGRDDAQRSLEVVVLDAERDGLLQITEALSRYDGDLDAVHVVSHGSDRGLQLGSTWLDRDELARQSDTVGRWREALTEDADLLLYGCDLAASGEGKALVESLASLTGADIAASDDRTGASAIGGDWVLEHTTGSIESSVVFTARTQQSFGTALGGTAVWTDKFAPGPQSSDFDGASFGPESATLPVGYWHVMVGAEAPTRDEKIVLGTDNSGDLSAMMWNGSTWSVLPGVSDSLNNREWSFDVAYSSQSGNALIVWADGSGGGLQTVTWDGSILSASTPVPVPFAGNLDHIKLAADPNSDEIMLVGSVAGNGDFAMVWDGASFVAQQVLPFGDQSSFTTDINVVYEGQSGNAMIVRGGGLAGAFYDTYDGSSWGFGGIFAPNPAVGDTKWTSIAADPNSDRLVMAAGTESGKVWLSAWNGTFWEVGVQAPSDNPHNDRQGVAVAFESTSGEAIAVYGTDNDDVRYQTWTSGSGWSGEQVGPALTSHIDSVTLDADPTSDTVMLSFVQLGQEAVFIPWDGASWGTPNVLEVDADTNRGQPFVFMWDQNPVANTAPVLTPGAPTLPSIDEDAVTNPGMLISSLLGGSVSDPDAGAQGGIAITGLTGNGTWEYSLDGGASWLVVPGTVTDAQALLLRDTDRVRYVPDGSNGEGADFDFRAWDRTTGSPGGVSDTTTNGGTTAFSLATDTASITVTDLNDAPILAPGTPSLTPIDENAIANGGDLVSALISGAISDVDLGALEGIAITGLSAGSGTWEFSTDGGTIWTTIGPVTTSAALLLRDSDRIRYVPDGQNGGTPSFDFVAWDRTVGTAGGVADASVGGGTSAFSSAADTASIVVSNVNDAPVLVPGAPSLTPITEDDVANGGDLVSSLLGGSVTDADTGAAEGIAITGLTAVNGTWQYSIDGGGSWNAIGAVSATSALLLRDGDLVRFVPDGQNGGTAAFDFRAWDQTTGTAGTLANPAPGGGTSAFSSASDTASILVSSANDAPVLVPGAPSLTPITEDDVANGGDLVSSLLGGSVTDADTGAAEGIAITGLTAVNGTWQYSIDGGGSWNAIGAVSATSALLLRDGDLVRFVPDGQNGGTAAFDFRAWDQTTGTAGTLANPAPGGGTSAFSSASDTASITVSDVNDAPVLDDTGTMTLTDVAESDPNPPGDTVANIVASALGDRITDVDAGDPEGIAVVGVDDTNGSWQYSTDGGTIWTAFGAVTSSTAVLLDAGALVRFVPTAGYLGPAGNITFHAWDQSVGANGQTGVDASATGLTTPFSVLSETATLDVTPRNFAPVLVPGAPALTPITEDQATNPGDLVSSLVGASISDLNAGALEGVAITGLSSASGAWQFSTNGGASWSAVVSSTSALLLRDTDQVRFVPGGQNAESASFTFRAWDRTTGTEGTKTDASVGGGSSAFSLASDTASINVTALNDAPLLGSGLLASVLSDDGNPPGATIAGLLAALFVDVDAGAGFAGVAVVGNSADPLTEGIWQYSSDGGASWFAIGAVGDDASALVIGTATRVRFAPVISYAGPTGLLLRGLDDAYAGPFSSTAGGVEARANVDASANGGTTSIAATPSSLTTSVIPAITTDDLQDLREDEEPPPAPEAPPVEEPEQSTEPTSDPPPVAGGSADSPPTAEAPAVPPALRGAVDAPLLVPVSRGAETTVESVAFREERDDHTTRQADGGSSLDVLRNAYLVQSPAGTSVLTDLIFGAERGEFLGALDSVQDDMLDLGSGEAAVVGSSLAVTSGLSVGYVLWLTRGGLLVASLLSSLPAWRLIDPIPILARLGLDEEADEGESLGAMVDAEAADSDEEAEAARS